MYIGGNGSTTFMGPNSYVDTDNSEIQKEQIHIYCSKSLSLFDKYTKMCHQHIQVAPKYNDKLNNIVLTKNTLNFGKVKQKIKDEA